MNKKPIIWSVVIILVIAVVGCFIFINYKNKNSAGNVINFYCLEGNLKAQFGKNYVVINFMNGKNILLPQTISGSGIRYELGSTTFIGKGDNAALVEGTTTAYTNCVAGNVVTNKNTNTYIDTSKSFSFSYPNRFILSGGDFGYSQNWTAGTTNLGILLVDINIPRTFFTEKTNFGEAKFTVGTSADTDTVKTCLTFNNGNLATSSEVIIGGIKFTKINFSDAGAGNYYETTSYRTVHNNQCYAIEYTIHSSNIYNYSPDQGVKEFDKTKVTSVLEGIAQSFKFI
jgi:membrane-bound inhibitor of C-type lysozyme